MVKVSGLSPQWRCNVAKSFLKVSDDFEGFLFIARRNDEYSKTFIEFEVDIDATATELADNFYNFLISAGYSEKIVQMQLGERCPL